MTKKQLEFINKKAAAQVVKNEKISRIVSTEDLNESDYYYMFIDCDSYRTRVGRIFQNPVNNVWIATFIIGNSTDNIESNCLILKIVVEDLIKEGYQVYQFEDDQDIDTFVKFVLEAEIPEEPNIPE